MTNVRLIGGRRHSTAAAALRGALLGSSEGAVPLPGTAYTPASVSAASLGLVDPGKSFSFYNVGDNGGVEIPTPQLAVFTAMAQDLGVDLPAFLAHVGDVAYFGGSLSAWAQQVFAAMMKLKLLMLGWPGNHDDARGGDPPIPSLNAVLPLNEWMANMCSPAPAVPDADPQFEYGRHTMTQPYCDWTAAFEGITMVGAWSNVPSGGNLFDQQVEWLTSQLEDAPTDRPLFLELHHPPLSVDAYGGGSQRMFDALTSIFTDAKRVPDVCVFGHVHDYQRFTWEVAGGTTTVIVTGNGGYHNLHDIASDYEPGMTVEPGVVCDFADASQYGYVKFSVTPTSVAGEYIGVKPGKMSDGSDPTVTRNVDSFLHVVA